MNERPAWMRQVQDLMDENTRDACHNPYLNLAHIDIIHSPTCNEQFRAVLAHVQSSRFVMFDTIPSSRSLELALSKARSLGWTGDTCIFILNDNLSEVMHATLEDISTGHITLERTSDVRTSLDSGQRVGAVLFGTSIVTERSCLDALAITNLDDRENNFVRHVTGKRSLNTSCDVFPSCISEERSDMIARSSSIAGSGL